MTAEMDEARKMQEFFEYIRLGRIVFGFDLDQVLCNTAKGVVGLYNARFKDRKRWQDVKQWGQLTPWLIEKGHSREEAERLEAEIWVDESMLLRADPIYAARLMYLSIAAQSFGRVHVITSRPPELRDVTQRWMRKWFDSPYFMPEQVWIREDDDITGEDYKIRMINRIEGLNIFIDDSLDTALRIAGETRACPVLLQSTQRIIEKPDEPIVVIPRRPDGQLLTDVLLAYTKGNLRVNLNPDSSISL